MEFLRAVTTGHPWLGWLAILGGGALIAAALVATAQPGDFVYELLRHGPQCYVGDTQPFDTIDQVEPCWPPW